MPYLKTMEALDATRKRKIIQLHNEVAEALKMSLEKAILIGQLLTEQKEKLKHGEFTTWINENLPFTDRTARNYIKLFNNKNRLITETVSDLSSAYKLLSPPKDEPEETSEDEIKQMNQRIKQMLRELPINESLSEKENVRDIPRTYDSQIFRLASMWGGGKILNELEKRWDFSKKQAGDFLAYLDYVRLYIIPKGTPSLAEIKNMLPDTEPDIVAKIKEKIDGRDIGDDLISIFSCIKTQTVSKVEFNNYLRANACPPEIETDDYINTMVESVAGKEKVKQNLLDLLKVA